MPSTIGIVFGSFEQTTQEILSYLVVYQNTLQNSFEFRILPTPNDSFIDLLSGGNRPSHLEIEKEVSPFLSRFKSWVNSNAHGYGLDSVAIDKIVVLTDTSFSDNYYYVGDENWAVIALGGWENAYAPPSIVEYYLSFVAGAAIDAKVDLPRHYETRGCVCDFNASLGDARLSVLSGYICDDCAREIKNQASNKMLEDTLKLLNRCWLGDPSAPSEAAVNVKKMGYDLFRTAGIKPSWGETIRSTLETEGLKNILNVTFQIILAFFLVFLGLKSTK